MTFATAALTGYAVKKAWLTFATEVPSGSTDYSDTFTAEAVDRLGEFEVCLVRFADWPRLAETRRTGSWPWIRIVPAATRP